MRERFSIITIGLCTIAIQLIGCTSPAPKRVAVPPRDQAKDYGRVHEGEEMKPLPGQAERETSLPRPYEDVPLVSQHPPEQHSFIEAYERVGRPRMMVVAGPADGGAAEGIDYAAVETLIADWLAANGRVSLISPPQRGASTAPSTGEPEADILVRSQISQTHAGKDVGEARIITEALNTRGGESIARAVVDVATPLEKKRLNEATRFIARKLMDEMTESWTRLTDGSRASSMPPPQPAPAAPTVPPASTAPPTRAAPPTPTATPTPPAPPPVTPPASTPPPPAPSTGPIR